MDILKRVSEKLQTVNEQLGQLSAEIIDTEMIRQANLCDWQQGNTPELDARTDDNGTFIINFKN